MVTASDAPFFLSLSPQMTDLQLRSRIASEAVDGVDDVWKDPATLAYYKQVLTQDAAKYPPGTPISTFLLPIEQQYLGQVGNINFGQTVGDLNNALGNGAPPAVAPTATTSQTGQTAAAASTLVGGDGGGRDAQPTGGTSNTNAPGVGLGLGDLGQVAGTTPGAPSLGHNIGSIAGALAGKLAGIPGIGLGTIGTTIGDVADVTSATGSVPSLGDIGLMGLHNIGSIVGADIGMGPSDVTADTNSANANPATGDHTGTASANAPDISGKEVSQDIATNTNNTDTTTAAPTGTVSSEALGDVGSASATSGTGTGDISGASSEGAPGGIGSGSGVGDGPGGGPGGPGGGTGGDTGGGNGGNGGNGDNGGYAYGGLIQGEGGPHDDDILKPVSEGEYVVQNPAVHAIGAQNLDFLNNLGQMPAHEQVLVRNILAQLPRQPNRGSGFMTTMRR